MEKAAPPPGRRGRPRTGEAAARRAALIDSAARTFLAHGFEGASMDMIARAAHVAKATIYSRFGSKAALFEAVALHSVSSMRSDFRGIDTEGREPDDVLLDFALRITAEVADPTRIAILRLAVAEKDRFPDIARRLHAHIAETVAPITAYLASLDGDRFAVADPAALAAHFINLANGGLRFLLTDDFSAARFRREWSQAVVRLFLDGIRRDRGG